MRVELDELGALGIAPDLPDVSLPTGAWTDSRNVRYRDGAAEKCRGYEQALGSLSATAIWASSISDGANTYWVYGDQSVLYATDGTSHANVSAISLSYQASDDLGYTGGAFHGFMLANDGVNIPQSWNPSLANRFVSLTAWPAITCKVLRPFKDFLFALRITDVGSYNPRLLRWSDRAPQGALPLSWDFADPTNQAGITELAQTDDAIVDALPLRDSLVIYKERHTWLAEYVGALDVFGFRQVFSEVGALAENCAVAFGSQHLVMTDSDVVLHDGNSVNSILDKRARKWLFSRINTTRYRRCFLAPDHRNREIYICFPEAGNDWPNLALVWNWADNTLHPYDLGGPKTFATPGIVAGVAPTFDSVSGSFDADAGTFDDETFSPFQSRILLLDAGAKKAYQNDTGETYDGAPMVCYAQRTGSTLTTDIGRLKRIKRLFPQVIGTAGEVLNFFIGTRTSQSGATQWSGPYAFTIGVDYKVDFRKTARFVDIRVEYTGAATFRLSSMGVEFEPSGYR